MSTSTPTDSAIVNAIALTLGCTPQWSADELDTIANLISQVRPNPGDQDSSEYPLLLGLALDTGRTNVTDALLAEYETQSRDGITFHRIDLPEENADIAVWHEVHRAGALVGYLGDRNDDADDGEGQFLAGPDADDLELAATLDEALDRLLNS